jgi:c(7)-type cytochrome triheme protein
MKIPKTLIFFSTVCATGLLFYACARIQQVQQPEVKSAPEATAVLPPPVGQNPPAMDIDTYTGILSDPNGLPQPGPPYARQNSDPHTAVKELPKDAFGLTDWVKAGGMSRASGEALYTMDEKASVIRPHESTDLSKPPAPPFNFNIEIPAVGAMPNVIFPHFPHTYWLDCANCHPSIFIMKKGANPISMVKIINGEFCGRCHGRVAFPLSDCSRCHVKPKG